MGWRAVVASIGVLAAAQAPAQAPAQTPVLALHYQDRPPYSQTDANGDVHGLVADPAAQALRRAGIAFRWTRTPSQRQLALIQAPAGGLHCGIGWFRSSERAELGRFSAALYRDRPLAALVREGAWPGAVTGAAQLLGAQAMRLLVKEGYSYGGRLDAMIVGAAHAPIRTSADPVQMSRMVASGRADWMIVAPEEAEVLLQPGLRLVPLGDEPQGPTRHLYCNRDVPVAWIERIDQALARDAPAR